MPRGRRISISRSVSDPQSRCVIGNVTGDWYCGHFLGHLTRVPRALGLALQGFWGVVWLRLPPLRRTRKKGYPTGGLFCVSGGEGGEAKTRRGSTDSSGTNPDSRTAGPGARSAEGLGPWMGPAIPAMKRPPSFRVRPSDGEATPPEGRPLWDGRAPSITKPRMAWLYRAAGARHHRPLNCRSHVTDVPHDR